MLNLRIRAETPQTLRLQEERVNGVELRGVVDEWSLREGVRFFVLESFRMMLIDDVFPERVGEGNGDSKKVEAEV